MRNDEGSAPKAGANAGAAAAACWGVKVGAAAAGVGTAARERGVAVAAERGASSTAPVVPLSCSVAWRSGGAAWATCSTHGLDDLHLHAAEDAADQLRDRLHPGPDLALERQAERRDDLDGLPLLRAHRLAAAGLDDVIGSGGREGRAGAEQQ